MIFKKISGTRKIFTIFFILLFIMSLVLAVLHVTNRAGFGIGTWFPPLYFLLLLAVTHNLHKFKKILKKAYKPLIYIFYVGMSAFCIIFIIFCILITGYSPDDIPDNPDLVIVLGCQVVKYEPGALLTHRLNTTVKTLNQYPGAFCIVAGGQGPDEIIPEAQAMKKYIVNNNINQARIFEEASSSNTLANLNNSKQIIWENNLKSENIIIVTSEYHVPRAMMIAERVFDKNTGIYAVKSETPFILFSAGITREFFAYVKSFIFDRE